MTPTVPQPVDLTALLREQVSALIDADVIADVDPERTALLAELRKNEYYWRGNQYLQRVLVDGSVVDYTPLGKVSTPENVLEAYDHVINDIYGYGIKYIAVAAQQPPRLKAVANDRSNEDHLRRVKKADKMIEYLRSFWNLKGIAREVHLLFWKSVAAFIYTPFVANADSYGETREPKIESRMRQIEPAVMECINCGAKTPAGDDPMSSPLECPQCGKPFGPEDYRPAEMMELPEVVGEIPYANGTAECHLCSPLTVSTPFWIKNIGQSPHLTYEYEEHKGVLLDAFKGLRELIGESDGEYANAGSSGNAARFSRDIATSPVGSYVPSRKNRWTYSRFWLRPSMYQLARGQIVIPGEMGEQQMLTRDALRKNFPDGLKVTRIQGKVVKLENERMDDVWSMAKPGVSENAYCDPLCKPLLSGQDLTNDWHNMVKETGDRMIPQTFIDVDRIDIQQRKKKQLPASFIPVKRSQTGRLDDSIAKVPVAEPNEILVNFPEAVREHNAEIVGVTRALFGGGDRTQTAYEANLKRNQAMMQHAIPLEASRELIATAVFNGVVQLARNSDGRVPSRFSPRSEMEHYDIKELAEGGWHVEAEDSMPMSWSERRASIMDLIEKGSTQPGMLDGWGFNLPDNIPKIQEEVVAIPDWKIPYQDARDKVLENIRRLLKAAPVQGMPDPMNPMAPPQLMPSIPVDEFEDDHGFVADFIRQWSQTEEARNEREENPEGYANVIAFGKAHLMLSPPPMPPEGAPDAPKGKGGQPEAATDGPAPVPRPEPIE